MKSALHLLPIAGAVLFLGHVRGQDLPSQKMDFEPDLLLTGPPAAAVAPQGPGAVTSGDLPKLQGDLERAKRTAANFEKLVKEGAVAKVEAERRAMRVIVLTKQIAEAKWKAALAGLDDLRKTDGVTSEAIHAAETGVQEAEAAAKTEAATCQKAQLDAAALNLWRWQKLLEFGGARKSDVARAREQLEAAQKVSASPEQAQASHAAEVANPLPTPARAGN